MYIKLIGRWCKMVGLYLKWSCKKCGTTMNDDVGIVNIYEVNGMDDFVKMKCDSCGHIHFVNTNNPNIVIDIENANVKNSGVCCF